MRVNQSNSNNPAQTADVKNTKQAERISVTKKSQKTDKASSTGATDTAANISSKGKDFAKARAVAKEAPEVREEKIAALKQRIANGKYKVDDKAIADKLVDEHIDMNGIG